MEERREGKVYNSKRKREIQNMGPNFHSIRVKEKKRVSAISF